MRKDQQDRLDDLSELLTDVFVRDADPSNWPGENVQEMTAQQRGDRNWTLKNANQVGALLMRTLELRDRITKGIMPPSDGETPDDRAEANISKYEKQAKKLLEAVSAHRGGGTS